MKPSTPWIRKPAPTPNVVPVRRKAERNDRNEGNEKNEKDENLAPQVGLEPTTLRLTAGCSAIELLRSGTQHELYFYFITQLERGVKTESVSAITWGSEAVFRGAGDCRKFERVL